jgi:hypothetical protein
MYKPIGRSNIVKPLMELVKQSFIDEWMPYYNFRALPVPVTILLKDPFFAKLAERYSFHAGILRMPESTCYNWHTDTERKVSINMLLQDVQSDCLFMDGDPSITFRFRRIPYFPETYYAFNTQVPHMVINHIGDRYMFSVEFLGSSKDLTFDELCNQLED